MSVAGTPEVVSNPTRLGLVPVHSFASEQAVPVIGPAVCSTSACLSDGADAVVCFPSFSAGASLPEMSCSPYTVIYLGIYLSTLVQYSGFMLYT